MNEQAPTLPAGQILTQPTTPAVETYAPVGTVELTTQQQHTLTQDMIKFGHIKDVNTANQMLAGEGVAPLPAPTAPILDPVQQHMDKTLAPARPTDYQMAPVPPGPKENLQRASQETFRTWMANDLQLPTQLGNTLAQTAKLEADKIAKISSSETDLAVWKTQQEASLKQVWGDKFDTNVALARKFLASTPNAGAINSWLSTTGLNQSASVIMQIHQQAERMRAMGKF